MSFSKIQAEQLFLDLTGIAEFTLIDYIIKTTRSQLLCEEVDLPGPREEEGRQEEGTFLLDQAEARQPGYRLGAVSSVVKSTRIHHWKISNIE